MLLDRCVSRIEKICMERIDVGCKWESHRVKNMGFTYWLDSCKTDAGTGQTRYRLQNGVMQGEFSNGGRGFCMDLLM